MEVRRRLPRSLRRHAHATWLLIEHARVTTASIPHDAFNRPWHQYQGRNSKLGDDHVHMSATEVADDYMRKQGLRILS